MRRARTCLWIAAALATAALLVLPAMMPDPGPPPSWEESGLTVAERPAQPGLDVTFLVASDTHFGAQALVHSGSRPPIVKKPIEPLLSQMFQEIEETASSPWPEAIGGRIAAPRGILLAGDLTDAGRSEEWRDFDAVFGPNGRFPFPSYAALGNHDVYGGSVVPTRIAMRHGAFFYSWDWDDLHLVCLGEGPDYRALHWLMEDLAKVGRHRPVVIFMHYPLAGPMSNDGWFGEGDYREHLGKILEGFNVAAIFHGHWHASGRYKWNGTDVYNVGSVKHGFPDFFVVRITDDRLTVASRYWLNEPRWWWWHSRPRKGRDGPVHAATDVREGDWRRPQIPYPR